MSVPSCIVDKPLRIGMMIETDGPGGAEVVLIQLSEELRRLGHTVIAVGPEKGRGWLSGRLRELGVERRTYSLRRPLDIRCLIAITRMLRTLQLDLVHSHEFTMAVYGAAACRLIGVRHVITLHGADSVFEARRRRAALRWALRNSHAMVAVSEHTRQHTANSLGVPIDKVERIRNGIFPPVGNRDRVRKELGLKEEEVLVLAVGNVRVRKGHMVLLRALVEVDRMGVNQPWHLAIAGEGDQMPLLRGFARDRRVESRLHLLGLRRDIGDLQAAADIFAMPSLWEGLPLALLEAMFSGNPVVASSVGGIPEAVENRVEGFLVGPGDVDALAGALKRLIENQPLRIQMGQSATRRVQDEFHVAKMAQRYLCLYRGDSQADEVG